MQKKTLSCSVSLGYRCELQDCFSQISQLFSTKILQTLLKTKIDCENEKEVVPGICQKSWTVNRVTIGQCHIIWWIQIAVVCCDASASCQKAFKRYDEKYILETMKHFPSQMSLEQPVYIFGAPWNKCEWSKVSGTVAG